ncbi:MAG TPA: hypothetical protein VIF02_01915 [Methylocella sp.]
MTKVTPLPIIAGALFACGLSATPAAALSGRTWVSGHGTDSGACTLAAPCKTFAFALTQTAPPGEIDVLDPGAFGKVTIPSSISIINDGVGVAAIGIGSGDAITITAGATDSIHLRGLIIEGVTGATNGIVFKSGGNLAIENCVLRNFVGSGISISPSTSSSFSVSNTIASNNNVGIIVQPTGSAALTGVFSNTTATTNLNGIVVNGAGTTGTLNVSIADSNLSNNSSGSGVLANSVAANPPVNVMLRNVVASNNGGGLVAQSNTIFRVAHSVITGNTTGVSLAGGGIINSYGDNDIDGNTSDNTGVLTVILQH